MRVTSSYCTIKDYMERMLHQTVEDDQNTNKGDGHREQAETMGTKGRANENKRKAYRKKGVRQVPSTPSRHRGGNADTEGFPAVVAFYGALAPAGGHLPLMLGFTLGAD